MAFLRTQRFDATLVEYLKALPGCTYHPAAGKGTWLVPDELRPDITHAAQQRSLLPRFAIWPGTTVVSAEPSPRLLPYQARDVDRALRQRSLLLNYETGLGKTIVAIETLRCSVALPAIIIMPAAVKTHWVRALGNWWPQAAGSPERSIETISRASEWDSWRSSDGTGLSSAAFDTIFVTSYEVAASAPVRGWNSITLDEAHYVKNHRAQRSKAIRLLLAGSPSAFRLALTATPADKVLDLFNQLDLLWPGRFGYFGKFRDRYMEMGLNGAGYREPTGLNPERIPELERRLDACLARATKAEWGHLLPPFQVRRLDATGSRLTAALEWLDTIREEGSERRCIITYRIQTAQDLHSKLPGSTLVHGDIEGGPQAREKLITEAASRSRSTLIATMKSVGIGIDLTAFDRVLVAEIYPSLPVMQQLLGRFSRLSGKRSSIVDLLVTRDPRDQTTAAQLARKVDELNALAQSGADAGALQGALEAGGGESLADIADGFVEVL